MVIQSTYAINPDRGWPGDIARPYEPHALDSGIIYVPDGATRNPRPGDAVYYNTARNAFAIPTDAAESAMVAGILSYRADEVANASRVLEYTNGAEVEVAVLGTWWVRAGAAMEYGQRIGWDRSDYEWNPESNPALALADNAVATINTGINALLAALGRVPIVCASRAAVAADGIAMARIGYGRVV